MNFKRYHVSKNLFDEQWIRGIYSTIDGTYMNASNRICCKNRIEVSPSISYSVTNTITQFRVLYYDINDDFISYETNKTTFTTPSNCKYIRFFLAENHDVSDAPQLMLNTGLQPLPYEPYGNTWTDIPHYIRNTATDTITTLPAVLYPNDTTATVGLKGNMEQSGTPTPDNPIYPSECGERTGNLFDKNSNTTNNNGYTRPGVEVPAGTYSINNGTSHHVYYRIGYSGIAQQTNPGMKTEGIVASDSLYVWRDANIREDGVMLNTGSTALPYEPYGYKIPISSASTATPVYLGEVETTRKVKKLVLDGTEDWTLSYGSFRINVPDYYRRSGWIPICTHYQGVDSVAGGGDLTNGQVAFLVSASANYYIYICDTNYTSAADFKSYLAQQYAAGTPVCVWYVLETEETGIVNEPLMRIGNYADTVSGITVPTITGADSFDVLTTLKPSEVDLTYHGWHDASAKEWDGSEWQ